MRLIPFGRFYLGKMWKNMEKRTFFGAATAGLGKEHMGGYGQIGVYRVILTSKQYSYLGIYNIIVFIS